MIEIHNQTEHDITLTSGHVIPAKGLLPVSAQTMTATENDAFGARMLASGKIAARRPVEAPEPLTRATIAKATRGELLDILEAQGIDRKDVAKRKVEDSDDGEGLRTLTARAIFADI